MSGEQDAIAGLRQAVAAPLSGLGVPVSMARDAQAAFRAAEDVVEAMGTLAGLILCLESAAAAFEAAAKTARAALARTMAETGATTVRTNAHTVSLKEAARRAIVTDTALIPPALMRQPPPAPDLTEIGKRLRDGDLVPGATLGNGGDPTLQIRNRERKAA